VRSGVDAGVDVGAGVGVGDEVDPGVTIERIVAAALIVAMRARPSRDSTWRDRCFLSRRTSRRFPDVEAPKT
jgi:hypothetical protein